MLPDFSWVSPIMWAVYRDGCLAHLFSPGERKLKFLYKYVAFLELKLPQNQRKIVALGHF